MPTQNVNLSQEHAEFIRQSIDGGEYRNVSEVVRAGLRLLKNEQAEERLKLRVLRRLATQAFDEIDQGKFQTVPPNSIDQFIALIDAKVRTSRG
jgi:antitoxin ParD1/3/4